MTETASERSSGKILRIKAGFNPNSSSIGSQIPYFFAFALGSGALTIMVLNLLNTYDRLIRPGKKEKDLQGETDR